MHQTRCGLRSGSFSRLLQVCRPRVAAECSSMKGSTVSTRPYHLRCIALAEMQPQLQHLVRKHCWPTSALLCSDFALTAAVPQAR